MTTTIPKSLAQLQAELYPLNCCEGAQAVVEVVEQAHFLAGTTVKHTILCNGCLKEVRPVTVTTLQP